MPGFSPKNKRGSHQDHCLRPSTIPIGINGRRGEKERKEEKGGKGRVKVDREERSEGLCGSAGSHGQRCGIVVSGLGPNRFSVPTNVHLYQPGGSDPSIVARF